MKKQDTFTATTDAPVEYVENKSKFDSMIDAWFVETFHNRDTDCDEMNRLNAQKQLLKNRIAIIAKE